MLHFNSITLLQAENGIKYGANGKLLLTGEYLVIDGASALALPVKFGQSLVCTYGEPEVLNWSASDVNGVWFNGKFSLPGLEIIDTDNLQVAAALRNILQSAGALNRAFFSGKGMRIETYLNFDRFLGLGSSSTLISLVADLIGIDKFKLHSMVSSGSGYDIACAVYSHPILFTRKSPGNFVIQPFNFYPEFAEQIYFIYQGNKQDTDLEISLYKNIDKEKIRSAASKISDITFQLVRVKDLSTFVSLIEHHERIMSDVLGRKGIKESRFQKFRGSIKSLGAWGGDFIMAVSSEGDNYVSNYFKEQGINILYKFSDLVLNEPVTNENEVNIRF